MLVHALDTLRFSSGDVEDFLSVGIDDLFDSARGVRLVEVDALGLKATGRRASLEREDSKVSIEQGMQKIEEEDAR